MECINISHHPNFNQKNPLTHFTQESFSWNVSKEAKNFSNFYFKIVSSYTKGFLISLQVVRYPWEAIKFSIRLFLSVSTQETLDIADTSSLQNLEWISLLSTSLLVARWLDPTVVLNVTSWKYTQK